MRLTGGHGRATMRRIALASVVTLILIAPVLAEDEVIGPR